MSTIGLIHDDAALTISRLALSLISKSNAYNPTPPTIIQSNDDANGAITITTDGGISESIIIQSLQGTSSSSILISSTNGGITLNAGGLITLSSFAVCSHFSLNLITNGIYNIPLTASGGIFDVQFTESLSNARIILPALCAGLNYKFFVTSGTDGGINFYYFLGEGITSCFYGSIYAANAGVSWKHGEGLYSPGGIRAGDNFQFVCDGAKWYVTGTSLYGL